jgi:hypothetical protein
MEPQDSGLASIKSLVALRDFDAAFDRFGSTREVASLGLMSAPAGSRHKPILVQLLDHLVGAGE